MKKEYLRRKIKEREMLKNCCAQKWASQKEIKHWQKGIKELEGGFRDKIEDFLPKALATQKGDIMEIIQKEIARADKYEIAPLERIRIKLIQLT